MGGLSSVKPSLEDYKAFHGMLCAPKDARRCIQSFEGGAILFASQEDYGIAIAGNKSFSNFDFNGNTLNIWTYYLLVIFSLTGLCSVLRRTKVIEAVEYNDSDDSGDDILRQFKKGDKKFIESSKTTTAKNPLRLPPEVIEYVIDRSFALGPLYTENSMKEEMNAKKDATISIATEEKDTMPELTLIRRFEYDFGGWLSVMMLHFVCTNGRMHLVEIYGLNKQTIVGFIVEILMKPLQLLKLILMRLRSQQLPVDDAKKNI